MEDIYYQKYLKYKNKYITLKNVQAVTQIGGSKEISSSKEISDREIYLFKADWCPHGVGFKPDWEKLQKNFGQKYKFITYDGDKDKDKVAEWKVQGFPTIMVKKEKEILEYLGPNEYNSVLDFIKHI